MHKFLQHEDKNVVVVHCLAGKGRTGTAICCYLIYSARFQTATDALNYYALQRLLHLSQIRSRGTRSHPA